MTKAEKKTLFQDYVKILDNVCEKKDSIEKFKNEGYGKNFMEMQNDSLISMEGYASGFSSALAELNILGEFLEMNW